MQITIEGPIPKDSEVNDREGTRGTGKLLSYSPKILTPDSELACGGVTWKYRVQRNQERLTK